MSDLGPEDLGALASLEPVLHGLSSGDPKRSRRPAPPSPALLAAQRAAAERTGVERAMQMARLARALEPSEAEREAERARILEEAAHAAYSDAAARAQEARQRRLQAEVRDVAHTMAALETHADDLDRQAVQTQLMMQRLQEERRTQNDVLLREALLEVQSLRADLDRSLGSPGAPDLPQPTTAAAASGGN